MLETKIKADNLPIKISDSGKNKRLVYDPQQKWKFLRLLDDGFLNSDMTGSNMKRLASDRFERPPRLGGIIWV
jgi:hypothetical protein